MSSGRDMIAVAGFDSLYDRTQCFDLLNGNVESVRVGTGESERGLSVARFTSGQEFARLFGVAPHTLPRVHGFLR
jgi:hypothetical protein